MNAGGDDNYDILISGAGPGGCACALALSDSGLKVALVDKATFPRDKICGDAVSGKVISVIKSLDPEFSYELRKVPEMIGTWGIRFVAPNGKTLDIPFKKTYDKGTDLPSGYVSMRLHFDQYLLDQVKKKGKVDIFEGNGVKEVISEATGYHVKLEKGSLHTQLIIGADGAHSVIAKKLGNIRVDHSHYCAGIRTYYENVGGMNEGNFIELHFLKNYLPGYFWIFPLPGNRANVGMGMLSKEISKRKINLKTEMMDIIQNESSIAPRFKEAKMLDGIKGFGLPLGSRKLKISGERFMLIGDAASLIDPFTGEGIGNAAISGKLAAMHAIRCFETSDFSAEFMGEYDQQVYHKLWAELKMSHTLQRLLNFPSLFNFFANKAGRNHEIRDMMTSMFVDMDVRKVLRNPLFYLKMLFS